MFPLVLLIYVALLLTAAEISRPVDLTHYFDENTVYAYGSLPFQFTEVITLPEGMGNSNWFADNEFEAAEHGGTHMDAPYHFCREGWRVGEIPFERFFGKAVYLNLRQKAAKNTDYGVSAEDFEQWEVQNGLMPSGAIVMLDFGWAEKYDNVTEYLGTTDVLNISSYRFPGLSQRGAEWLVGTGKVFGVGTDTVCIDVGYDMEYNSGSFFYRKVLHTNVSKGYPAHTILTANNLYILELVALPLLPLDPCGYGIQALPMKIRNGTGAPCRVLAIP